MPRIQTSNGSIRYKTIPLYQGIKMIDKPQATENLLLLKTILEAKRLRFMLIAGTLLGAVREGDFITHDEDIDIAFLSEDKQRVIDALPDMIDQGFAVARYNRRGIISIMRKGEYIDLYFFSPYDEGRRACDGWIVLEQFLTDTAEFSFKGSSFLAPREYREYLLCEYGVNWETPIAWNNYQMPSWRIAWLKLKEHIKDWMPDRFYFYLARPAERRHEEQCNARHARYYNLKNNIKQ